jgi:hypothetical protein
MIYGFEFGKQKYGKTIRTRKAVSAIVNFANFSHRSAGNTAAWYHDAGLGSYLILDKAVRRVADVPPTEYARHIP